MENGSSVLKHEIQFDENAEKRIREQVVTALSNVGATQEFCDVSQK